jgi:hypothetical protein
MPESPLMRRLPKLERPVLIAAIAVAGLGAWVFLHPGKPADPAGVSPAVKTAFAKLGFKPPSGAIAARFTNFYGAERFPIRVEQKIRGVGDLFTEKRSQRHGERHYEESVGLYAGPFGVVHHSRVVLPLMAWLLPGQFWSSTRITEVVIERLDPGFPETPGAGLVARLTYQTAYSNDELAYTEHVQLSCLVRDVVEASSVNPLLTDRGSRIDCSEQLESRHVVHPQADSPAIVEHMRYTHLYVKELGWSIPVEGERSVRIATITEKDPWTAELKAFSR